MMKAKFFCLFLAIALLLCFVGCSYSKCESCKHLVVGSDAKDVAQVIVDYYVDGAIRETIGACNADNSPLHGKETLHFDIPSMYGESFICRISVVNKAGDRITNEKMKASLPCGKENYRIQIITDSEGDYALLVINE